MPSMGGCVLFHCCILFRPRTVSVFGQKTCASFHFGVVMTGAAVNILSLLSIYASAWNCWIGLSSALLDHCRRLSKGVPPAADESSCRWQADHLSLKCSASPGGLGWGIKRNLFMVLYGSIVFPHFFTQVGTHSVRGLRHSRFWFYLLLPCGDRFLLI